VEFIVVAFPHLFVALNNIKSILIKTKEMGPLHCKTAGTKGLSAKLIHYLFIFGEELSFDSEVPFSVVIFELLQCKAFVVCCSQIVKETADV
jgi:hypothetical protein